MKKFLFAFIFLLFLAASFLSGIRYNHTAGSKNPDDGVRRVLYYVDPMNPSHTSDKPGIAPCGMALEPVYADEDATGSQSAIGPMAPGTVKISPQKQQMTGIRIGAVEVSSQTHTLRTLGRIAADDNRVYRLISATDGWMADADQSTVGSLVKKGELMALIDVYNNDFFAWQQRYLTELGYMGFARQPGTPLPEIYQRRTTDPGLRISRDRPSVEPPGMQRPGLQQPTIPQPGTTQNIEMKQTQTNKDTKPNPVPQTPEASPQPDVAHPEEMQKDVMALFGLEAAAPGQPQMQSHEATPQPGAPVHAGPPSHQMPTGAGQKPEIQSPEAHRHTDKPLMTKMTVAEYYAKKAMLELLNLGVGENQLDDLVKSKQYATYVEVRSPVTGFVLARNVFPGQRVDKGTEFFKVADLSHVWVVADVFSAEAQYIRPGMHAKILIPEQNKTVEATVSDILPPFDATARTLKVRLEADNPDFVLRPEMFVDVVFQIPLPHAMNVPADAVLDSGRRKIVFVALENGYFEPRTVETGWRFGDRVQIAEGLMPGDRIVVSGNFLIDSDSRMKLAAAGLYGTPEKDPVCGMEVYPSEARPARLTSVLEGKTYYFCSEACKTQFEKEPRPGSPNFSPPAGAVKPAGADNATGSNKTEVARDPVCLMVVHQGRSKAQGLMSEYRGKTYYFCSKECKDQFDLAPQPYLAQGAVSQGQKDAPSQREPAHD